MSSAEKQRLYTEVGVTRTTVQRWRNGENTPDPSHVHRLLNTLQHEEQKQLRTLMQDDPTLQMPEEMLTDELLHHIPHHVYEEVLRLARDAPNQFWLLGGNIVFHALSQLETTPQETGVEVLIARCMPPEKRTEKFVHYGSLQAEEHLHGEQISTAKIICSELSR
ncbi:hypothetical protein KDW_07140 [Dictyobacter vulcani]|uniref:Uncharacterized protein n=2 Tax=Dictyobacter vulcani TaxID=2607529 RepID=A0A5J4KI15_9CHLR|nr:hypothetical protein KDW_07140 [Dictyobacter vulcani]